MPSATKNQTEAAQQWTVVPAQADGGAAPRQPGLLDTMPMLIAIFAIFYFFLIRPQNKAREEHQKLIGGLKKGDEVMTDGGLLGTIFEVRDDRVLLEVASGVRIAIHKASIKAGAGELAAAAEKGADKKKEG